jgi:hypothetical protein
MFASLKRRKRALYLNFVLLVLVAGSICGLSQVAPRSAHKVRPELKLRIVPDNEAYSLHEKVFTKTEFTNLTGKTLCFQKPAQAHEIVGVGYVKVNGEFLDDSSDGQIFIDHYDGGPTEPREKLLEEIEQQWIKLAPNATYETKSAVVHLDLSVSGRWRLKGAYHPPECSFNTVRCNDYLRSTAQSAGCFVPEKFVAAEPVTINVAPTPNQK